MKKALVGIGILAALGLYYYFALPVFNIHSQDMWIAVLGIIFLCVAAYTIKKNYKYKNIDTKDKGFRIGVGILGAAVLIFLIGMLLSTTFINADKYQKLMTVENRDFQEDVKEISYDKIPILDKDSATILANRKMGSMVDMVSQYEVSDLYTQINYNNKPVRVTPLRYASVIKWLTNHSEGIPAYMKIDMTTQNVECVKLEDGIKYSPYEYFNRNLDRHLRFQYPTYIFDGEYFEVDEEGTPYWICPVKKFTIGLFGGETIGKVVLCNAITGECTEYDIEEVPSWIDRVYSSDMLIKQFDYHGTLKHGFWNSVLGQKDCLQTTNGYNYIAMDDDVWLYTGVTSVSGDQSNVGFVLINQRTRETRFYSVEGAIEDSAMSSAEGQVQNLGYEATFPLLLNISNQPTYFVALKDDAGLVKKYAMVNVQKYQIVAIGDTVLECEEAYTKLMYENNLIKEEEIETTEKSVTGVIEKIAPVVLDGDSHYYILLEDNPVIYDVPVKDVVEVLYLNEDYEVTFIYDEEASEDKSKDESEKEDEQSEENTAKVHKVTVKEIQLPGEDVTDVSKAAVEGAV